jgi:hypothetical protein
VLDLDAIPAERPLYARATACGNEVRPSAEGRLPLASSGSDRLAQLLCKPQFNE